MPGELVDKHLPPRRWLLITREAGIALVSDDGGGSRWSLDHLFVDQDGIPTLVEVKRASDTRGRREVVAQMLDYAASLSGWGPGADRRGVHRSLRSQRPQSGRSASRVPR